MTMTHQLEKATESDILFIYVAIVFVLEIWDVKIVFWSKASRRQPVAKVLETLYRILA